MGLRLDPNVQRPARVELPRHLLAFEKYYQMGAGRSLSKLAALLGKKGRGLTEWSRWFRWQERIDQRAAAEIEQAEAEAEEAVKESRRLAKRITGKALKVVDKVLDSKSERLSLQAAEGVLKGTEVYRDKSKVEIESNVNVKFVIGKGYQDDSSNQGS